MTELPAHASDPAGYYRHADLVPDLGPARQPYAAGFLLDDRDRVALVRKARPSWQAGKLNGIGGHVEPGESPAAAMRREFAEEAGLDLPGWEHVATVTFAAGAVWFFRLFTDPGTLDAVTSCTDEPVGVYTLTHLLGPAANTIPNLRWLLPLSAYRRDRYTPLLAHEHHTHDAGPAGDPARCRVSFPCWRQMPGR